MDFITILGVIFLVVIVGFVIKHIGSALLGAGKSLGIILLGAILLLGLWALFIIMEMQTDRIGVIRPVRQDADTASFLYVHIFFNSVNI